MPPYYWYHCESCSYRAYRYRNLKRCPDCGSLVVRKDGGQAPRGWRRHPTDGPAGQGRASWRGKGRGTMERPLALVTSDDGFESEGL